MWNATYAVLWLALQAGAADLPQLGEIDKAIALGQTQKVEQMLLANPLLADAPFNAIQETPLTLAALNGRAKIISMLIAVTCTSARRHTRLFSLKGSSRLT